MRPRAASSSPLADGSSPSGKRRTTASTISAPSVGGAEASRRGNTAAQATPGSPASKRQVSVPLVRSASVEVEPDRARTRDQRLNRSCTHEQVTQQLRLRTAGAQAGGSARRGSAASSLRSSNSSVSVSNPAKAADRLRSSSSASVAARRSSSRDNTPAAMLSPKASNSNNSSMQRLQPWEPSDIAVDVHHMSAHFAAVRTISQSSCNQENLSQLAYSNSLLPPQLRASMLLGDSALDEDDPELAALASRLDKSAIADNADAVMAGDSDRCLAPDPVRMIRGSSPVEAPSLPLNLARPVPFKATLSEQPLHSPRGPSTLTVCPAVTAFQAVGHRNPGERVQ